MFAPSAHTGQPRPSCVEFGCSLASSNSLLGSSKLAVCVNDCLSNVSDLSIVYPSFLPITNGADSRSDKRLTKQINKIRAFLSHEEGSLTFEKPQMTALKLFPRKILFFYCCIRSLKLTNTCYSCFTV